MDVIENYLMSCEKYFIQKEDTLIETSNGLYKNKEAIWRSLSHELVFWEKRGKKNSRVEFLLDLFSCNLKSNDIFYHMDSSDSSNGVIGSAWLYEGLNSAFNLTKDDFYLQKIIDVFSGHRFDYKIGLWQRPNGGRLDQTINHQIWYAYGLFKIQSLIPEKSLEVEALSQIQTFFEKLENKIHLHPNGIAHHRSLTKYDFRSKLRFTFNSKKETSIKDIYLVYKSIGYFPFLMMPLLYLEERIKENNFFISDKWSSLKNSISKKDNLDLFISEFKYGTNYNLSIFELASIYKKLNLSFPEELIAKQIEIIDKQSGFEKGLSLVRSYELMFYN